MTSDEIKKITDENYRAWEPNNPNMPTEVAIMQAMWEAAYQLAVLNENNTLANVQITGDNRLLVRMDEGGVMADTKQATAERVCGDCKEPMSRHRDYYDGI